ncbi:hypothetical protein [Streptomyces shenzhenensis]|uniref:hypothetical protein n=1 Tax=Streptomyces shenzhenensis TaxID=943815 RepID=UPI0036AE9D03
MAAPVSALAPTSKITIYGWSTRREAGDHGCNSRRYGQAGEAAMNGDGGFCEPIFGMPLPACLATSIQDRSWMDLTNSPKIEEVFGQAPVRPRFYSISGITAATKWWRNELDEETLTGELGCDIPGRLRRPA